MSDSSEVTAVHVETVDSFEQRIAEDGRLLVDFYADWCGPCQMIAPTVDELAAESEATVAKVDVEALPQIAARYDISSIPTFLVFDDGEVVDRLVGMKEKKTLAAAVGRA